MRVAVEQGDKNLDMLALTVLCDMQACPWPASQWCHARRWHVRCISSSNSSRCSSHIFTDCCMLLRSCSTPTQSLRHTNYCAVTTLLLRMTLPCSIHAGKPLELPVCRAMPGAARHMKQQQQQQQQQQQRQQHHSLLCAVAFL